jgi:hypothetical protein
MNAFMKEIKSYGYLNHLMCILFVLFFLFVSKKMNLQFNLFGVIYWYVACLLTGHYAANNVKPTKKWKYKKSKNDTFIALPIVGGVNILTYGIPIYLIDHFFLKIL